MKVHEILMFFFSRSAAMAQQNIKSKTFQTMRKHFGQSRESTVDSSDYSYNDSGVTKIQKHTNADVRQCFAATIRNMGNHYCSIAYFIRISKISFQERKKNSQKVFYIVHFMDAKGSQLVISQFIDACVLSLQHAAFQLNPIAKAKSKYKTVNELFYQIYSIEISTTILKSKTRAVEL